jgi:hypothetical protein
MLGATEEEDHEKYWPGYLTLQPNVTFGLEIFYCCAQHHCPCIIR